MTNCCPPTPLPPCDLTCEQIHCELDAANANIDNLFNRTNNLNQGLEDLNVTVSNIVTQSQFVIVTTESELAAALLKGGLIFVRGTIQLNNTHIIGVPYTTLWGMLDIANAEPGGFQGIHDTGVAEDLFTVQAKEVTFRDLEIFSNHPLVSDNTTAYCGIRLSVSTSIDISGLKIINCRISRFASAILRHDWNPSMTVASRIKITDNYFFSLYSGGININGQTDGMMIDNNYFSQRLSDSDTHPVGFNAIFTSNNNNRTIISNNKITRCGRHAIEYYNVINGGNIDGKIINNTIWNNGWLGSGNNRGSYGISAFGSGTLLVQGNSVRGGNGIAIEAYNDSNNNALNNIVDNVITDYGSYDEPIGISLDGVTGANVSGNTIRNSVYRQPSMSHSSGIKLLHTCTNVNINGNDLLDAGTIQIWLAGGQAPVAPFFSRISIENNRITTTSDIVSGPGVQWEAILLQNFITASVRNNISWISGAAIDTTRGRFRASSSPTAGMLYQGDWDQADLPVTAIVDIQGSNKRAVFPPY